MTLPTLIDFMSNGREIEFIFNNHPYFLAPLYLDGRFSYNYYIYDVATKEIVFTGSLDKTLAFEFAPNVSLKESVKEFVFEYVL